jgi:hypothetical protein
MGAIILFGGFLAYNLYKENQELKIMKAREER